MGMSSTVQEDQEGPSPPVEGQYDDDDDQADAVWAAIDERMNRKRAKKRKLNQGVNGDNNNDDDNTNNNNNVNNDAGSGEVQTVAALPPGPNTASDIDHADANPHINGMLVVFLLMICIMSH